MNSIDCPNDGKNLEELTEEERKEAKHCRLYRFLKCVTEPDPDEEE